MHQEPKRSVQSTEHVDLLTVVDREDLNRETRYTQPMAVRKPDVSVHTVDDVYLQVNFPNPVKILNAFL